ncbi:MAG: hypothetical protein KY432_09600, partial [Acidobacteria bacterium]|nr:hypothetical protein [Acidobacteriota bacterium]
RSAVPGAWQYQLAPNGSRNLVVWRENVEEDEGRVRAAVMAQQLSHEGNFLGEPLELAEGVTPGVAAHGDGWLVTWTRPMDERLQYLVVGADGLPSGEPRLIAEPILEPGFRSPQVNPSFVRVKSSVTLIFWQEGDFQSGPCRIICGTPAGPGKIRGIQIEDGIVDEDSLRSYPAEVPRIRPVAEMMEDRILLTFLEQNAPVLRGLFLDPKGEPISSEFPVSSETHRADGGSTPSIVAFDDAFVVVWDRSVRNDSGSEILGAIVRHSDSQADVEQFLLSDYVAGGRFSTAKRIGPSSLVVIYDRPVEGGGYGGTWQIVARQVTIDVPSERGRLLRRR